MATVAERISAYAADLKFEHRATEDVDCAKRIPL